MSGAISLDSGSVGLFEGQMVLEGNRADEGELIRDAEVVVGARGRTHKVVSPLSLDCIPYPT